MTNRPIEPNDAPELQEVLTRYIDSKNGYHQAEGLVKNSIVISGFRQIAARRATVIERLASAISDLGRTPVKEGSTEAKIHRWWIELRAGMSSDELSAVLSECLRGEQELERTLESTFNDSHLKPEHQTLIASAKEDVHTTVGELEKLLEAL